MQTSTHRNYTEIDHHRFLTQSCVKLMIKWNAFDFVCSTFFSGHAIQISFILVRGEVDPKPIPVTLGTGTMTAGIHTYEQFQVINLPNKMFLKAKGNCRTRLNPIRTMRERMKLQTDGNPSSGSNPGAVRKSKIPHIIHVIQVNTPYGWPEWSQVFTICGSQQLK